MQTCKAAVGENTTRVLSTDSDLFKFLRNPDPGKAVVSPAQDGGALATGHRAPAASSETPS